MIMEFFGFFLYMPEFFCFFCRIQSYFFFSKKPGPPLGIKWDAPNSTYGFRVEFPIYDIANDGFYIGGGGSVP